MDSSTQNEPCTSPGGAWRPHKPEGCQGRCTIVGTVQTALTGFHCSIKMADKRVHGCHLLASGSRVCPCPKAHSLVVANLMADQLADGSGRLP